MDLLADENIDGQIVDALREKGYIVGYVAEMDPGISDEVVLELANREGALLLTADKDFGELVYRLRRLSTGVVLVRLAGLSPSKKSEIVVSASSIVQRLGMQGRSLPGSRSWTPGFAAGQAA